MSYDAVWRQPTECLHFSKHELQLVVLPDRTFKVKSFAAFAVSGLFKPGRILQLFNAFTAGGLFLLLGIPPHPLLTSYQQGVCQRSQA